MLYLSGLGATDTPVDTGAASPSDPLARVQLVPTVALNGENAAVIFAGLTPGSVGLYQVDFQVPEDAPDGDLPLVIKQLAASSNSVILPVKK
jgi:uncharacterized protein (TIGR03437 family)